MNTQHNNLVTQISELEAEVERLKLTAWDHYAAAALQGLLGGRTDHLQLELIHIDADVCGKYADACMAERERR